MSTSKEILKEALAALDVKTPFLRSRSAPAFSAPPNTIQFGPSQNTNENVVTGLSADTVKLAQCPKQTGFRMDSVQAEQCLNLTVSKFDLNKERDPKKTETNSLSNLNSILRNYFDSIKPERKREREWKGLFSQCLGRLMSNKKRSTSSQVVAS